MTDTLTHTLTDTSALDAPEAPDTISAARGATPTVDLAGLAARVRGRVLPAGTEDYAAVATPWNLAVPTTHLAAIEVADAADVSAVVRFAAESGLEVAVQATGHGAYATGRPSLLVLTHRLDEVVVNPQLRTARVGGGVRWSTLLEAAAPYGLAAPVGSAPNVGIVGYVTGGGNGPLSRTLGWASDRVTAFDVVTGDGELRRATPTENLALFWGLRGGKGALGIVVAVEMDLVALPQMFAGCLYFDGADAPAVLRAWAAWAPTLPVEGNTSVAVLRLPEMPSVPPPLAGRTTVAVRYSWVGDPADGEAAAAAMASVAPPIFGGLGVMPFAAVGMIHADPVDPMPSFEGASLLHSLPEEAVETLLALAGPEAACPQVIVELRLLGGALATEPTNPSALCHRSASFSLLTIGIAVPPVVEATMAHSAAVRTAMLPWSIDGGLPNFAPSFDPSEVARRYDGATFARLGTLSATYDPHAVLLAAAPFREA